MPSLPSRPTLAIVFSTPFFTIPSPLRNSFPARRHLIAHQRRMHGAGNLRRAGGLGSIADRSGKNGQPVDNRVIDEIQISPVQISDGRTAGRIPR